MVPPPPPNVALLLAIISICMLESAALLGKLVCVLICSRGIYYVAITRGANVFSGLSIDSYLGFINVRASIALSFSRFLKPNEFWLLPLLWIDIQCLLTLLYL